jgi:hypothetical protein
MIVSIWRRQPGETTRLLFASISSHGGIGNIISDGSEVMLGCLSVYVRKARYVSVSILELNAEQNQLRAIIAFTQQKTIQKIYFIGHILHKKKYYLSR